MTGVQTCALPISFSDNPGSSVNIDSKEDVRPSKPSKYRRTNKSKKLKLSKKARGKQAVISTDDDTESDDKSDDSHHSAKETDEQGARVSNFRLIDDLYNNFSFNLLIRLK